MWQSLEKWDGQLMASAPAWSEGVDAEARAEMEPYILEIQRQEDTHWLWDLTRRVTARRTPSDDVSTVEYLAATMLDRMLLGFTEPQWLRLVSVLGMLIQRAPHPAPPALLALLHYILRAAFSRASGAGLLAWRRPPPAVASLLPCDLGAHIAHPLRRLFGADATVAPPGPSDIVAAPAYLAGHTAALFARQTSGGGGGNVPWDRTLTAAVYESIVAILARTLKQHKRYALVPGLFAFSAVPHHRTAFAPMSNTLFHAARSHAQAGLQRYAHQVRVLARDLVLDAVPYTVHPANTAFLFDHFFVSYLGATTRSLFVDLAKCTALVYRAQLSFVAPHLTAARAPPRNGLAMPWYTTDVLSSPSSPSSPSPGRIAVAIATTQMAPLLGPGGKEEGPGSTLGAAARQMSGSSSGRRRRRIGYISAFFHDLHSVYRDRQGIIRQAPSDEWDVTLFAVQAAAQPCVRRMFDSADRVVLLAANLAEAQNQIAEQRLDVLVFCDIGMYPLTYYLAFARLATVQINTWGHSDTSGVPNVDYFLSSRWFAGPEYPDGNPQSEFSEQLVLLDSLTTFYQPLYDSTSYHLPRSEFRALYREDNNNKGAQHVALAGGLPTDGPLLVCMQSLFKFSDEFLDIMVRCLARCPTAYVLVLRDGDPATSGEQATFEERLDATLLSGVACAEQRRHALRRVLMLDRLQMVAYQSLLLYADLFLDPYPFGGCNSSLESFQHGQVVVTWPHPVRLSGRFTAGLYRRMGLAEADNRALVSGADQYVDAVEYLLGHHEDLEALRAQVRARRHLLFAEQESVDEWYAVVGGLLDGCESRRDQ